MSDLVRDTGEFTLIERLIAALPESVRGTGVVEGQQDDSAWWQNTSGASVVSTDALVEGVHFRLDWTDWFSLGHKMIAVNLSDLASMGCTPTVALVTLALTGNERVGDLEDMYRGAGTLAEIYGVSIVGGDIVRTPGPFTISVTAFGVQDSSLPVMQRSQAKPGDFIVVSGTLGASAAGLRLLQENRREAATADLLIGAHLRPAPRVSLGQALIRNGVACCMDLSDGLLGDLPKILRASGVGANVDAESIPVLPAVRAHFPEEYLQLAMAGGEDYELLCTLPPQILDTAMKAAKNVGATLTVIGEVDPDPGMRFSSNSEPLEADAWDHFGGKNV